MKRYVTFFVVQYISLLLLLFKGKLFLTFSVLVAKPKKPTLLHGGQSRSWSAEQGKENVVQLD